MARKLRIFGFDTLYCAKGKDTELLEKARLEKRVLLTADEGLIERSSKRHVRAILVAGRTDRARLLSLMRQVRLESFLVTGGESASRCAECNGELLRLAKREAERASIPPKVLAGHRLFYRCVSCGRLYWKGGHWKRLRRLSYSLKKQRL